ncbi:hypothetical protein TrRE_jg5566, partial [Triparma retinervis]
MTKSLAAFAITLALTCLTNFPVTADLFSHPIVHLTQPDDDHATSTDTFTLEGKYSSHDTAVFHGIPYATAPIGDMRFKSPQPLTSPQSDAKVTEPKSMCPQFSFTKNIHLGEEDCLHLSIYIPKNKKTGINNNEAFPPKTPLPVMFWIFGGAFVLGDNQEFE